MSVIKYLAKCKNLIISQFDYLIYGLIVMIAIGIFFGLFVGALATIMLAPIIFKFIVGVPLVLLIAWSIGKENIK